MGVLNLVRLSSLLAEPSTDWDVIVALPILASGTQGCSAFDVQPWDDWYAAHIRQRTQKYLTYLHVHCSIVSGGDGMSNNKKKRLVFDVEPEEHEEFMRAVRRSGMTAVGYFLQMRSPLPRHHADTRTASERDVFLTIAVKFLERAIWMNSIEEPGTKDCLHFMRDENMGKSWRLSLDRAKECIEHVAQLPAPGTPEGEADAPLPERPRWMRWMVEPEDVR